jgi:hypothetical protein
MIGTLSSCRPATLANCQPQLPSRSHSRECDGAENG